MDILKTRFKSQLKFQTMDGSFLFDETREEVGCVTLLSLSLQIDTFFSRASNFLLAIFCCHCAPSKDGLVFPAHLSNLRASCRTEKHNVG